MIDKIKEHIAEAKAFKAQTKEDVEAFRIKYLGKKGLLNQFFADFKTVANDQKKEYGQALNTLKKTAEETVNTLKEALDKKDDIKGIYGDLSRPGAAHGVAQAHAGAVDVGDVAVELQAAFAGQVLGGKGLV